MRTERFGRRFVLAMVAVVCLFNTGCNPFTALYFLFLMPPPKTPAASTDLEDQKVVVMAFASHGAKYAHPTIDTSILRKVIMQLRENVDDIEIVDTKAVSQWVDVNMDYDFEQVGKQFEATRVLTINVEEFSLYETQSSHLYRGSARVHLQVLNVENGDLMYEDYLELKYPGERPVPVSEVSLEKFKLIFMHYMCRKIATRFFGYRANEDFTIN